MARESGFIESLGNKLPSDVHSQSMTMAATVCPGTPDRYYDLVRDLWVEFKVVNGKLGKLLPQSALPTEKQCVWLNRRYAAGGNAVVLVGVMVRSRWHGIILDSPDLWTVRHPREFVEARLRPVSELADYLLSRIS